MIERIRALRNVRQNASGRGYRSWFRIPLAMLAVLASSATGQAATLYFDDFNGSSSDQLSGLSPDITIGSAIWQGATGYKADGSVNALTGGIYLPFTPKPRRIYELSASFLITPGFDLDWFAVGFGGGSDSAVVRLPNNVGRGWSLQKVGSLQSFIGPVELGMTSLGTPNAMNVETTITITLDASSSNPTNWTFSVEHDVNGSILQSLSEAPANVTSVSDLTVVGISNQTGFGRFTRFQLVTVPEPSTYATGLIAAGIVVGVARRKSTSAIRRDRCVRCPK